MIHFAIVGCGHIAKKHAEAIEQIPDAKLTAVCDTVPFHMDYYRDRYNAETYIHFNELLDDPAIDVINICTPSGFHAALAVRAAKAKKHIIVEKPIALSLEDTDQIIRACEENSVKLAVIHPNRFRPAMMELKKIVESGKLGKISHVNATVRWNRNQSYYDQAPWRGTKSLDGGVLMNQAIHNLDLMLWMMGGVQEVFSMSATRLRNIEAEDVCTGLVKFANGALGVIETATTVYPRNFEESLSIFAENGTIKIGGPSAIHIEHWDVKGMNREEVDRFVSQIEKDPYGKPGHQCLIEDMIQAIKEDRQPAVTGTDGKRALELVLAMYKSAETNQPFKLTYEEVPR
ncbi:Gfo/Idh/MocA family oxidoreductase [Fictibacillus sp. Mic-4]|uniref:Gfo/Idh/MocA family protein n=1 Tax=Fictibacillus TaxID=1329200 RepID=UPI00041B63E4|nr:Gfo/Idh/MocA family oxidoreductase [Fictibacillus gelatini]